MKLNLDKEVLDIKAETVQIRRDIHKNPELGFEEFRTSQLIYDYLKDLGYEVSKIAKTGVIGLLKVKDAEKTIGIRADIDCLPLQELNTFEYASINHGKMHACGHDGHTATALSVAKILKQKQHLLKSNIKFLFQPAEESPGGALPMIEEGALENPKVDTIIGMHVWNENEIGKVVVKSGPLMASADEFKIKIKGKGGHGAVPQFTVDSIVVAAHVITALQTIVSRNVGPLEPAVLTIGKIQGGSNFNIIAETTEMIGTVRTFDTKLSLEMEEKINKMVKNVTEAFGASYELEYTRIYPPTFNDEKISEKVKEIAEKVVGKENVITTEMTMGAEDMSFFLQKVPGCYFLVGSANKEKGITHPHHSPYFDFDENALSIGTQIMLDFIFSY